MEGDDGVYTHHNNMQAPTNTILIQKFKCNQIDV